MFDLNIVLVNFHYHDDIPQAIDSILKDIAGCSFVIQITVVDNSQNSDGLKEKLAKYSTQVKYIASPKNVGHGKGNALGFQAVPARYYFSLNRDTLIPENSQTIKRLIEFMDAHPKIGCIGPKLINMRDELQDSCYRFDLRSLLIKPLKQINWDEKYRWVEKQTNRLLMKDFDHNETRPVDWVLGAAMVVRHQVAKEIGWFDKRYFMYLEDCDWCKTMWEAGWPVYYVHDIIIKHRYDRGSAKVPGVLSALIKNKLARAHLVSWLRYMWKWRKVFKYYAI